jgi:transcriptional accessory protein Tex/SPT6
MTASIEATPISSATTPNVAVNDIGDEEAFLAAIDETIKYFNDGDIVEGVIVKVDRDEVLLDIGYKTEGVIPSRELSIKHDVDPAEVVSVGDEVEALVLQKEDKEGRLILSKKRAQYERAWGTIERTASSPAPSSRSSRAASSWTSGSGASSPPRSSRCVACATSSRTSARSSRRRSSSSTRTATTSCSRVARGSSRPSPRCVRAS